MKFAKGKPRPPTAGRRRGTPNKVTQTLADAIDTAFHAVGGAEYLEKIASHDPKAFCALLGRRLPKDLTLKSDGSIVIQVITGVPPGNTNR